MLCESMASWCDWDKGCEQQGEQGRATCEQYGRRGRCHGFNRTAVAKRTISEGGI